jgi:ParB-like chromosome segregation protein Spo0J
MVVDLLDRPLAPEALAAYQILPPLGADEYAALKADIARHGVLVPVELDAAGHVLDGHHRLRAAHELGIAELPTLVRTGLSEDAKREHALRLNLLRRHLGPVMARQRVAAAHQAVPDPEDYSDALAGLEGEPDG